MLPVHLIVQQGFLQSLGECCYNITVHLRVASEELHFLVASLPLDAVLYT
jgi:hypothetical protein